MAFRLPADLATVIRAQAVGEITITDVVIRMLRSAPVRLNYAEFHDGVRPVRKLSKKSAHIAALKASDPLGADRDDIEHGNMELPSGGSVSVVGAAIPMQRRPSGKPDAYQSRGMRPKGAGRDR